MWFNLVFLIILHSKMSCSAQHTCTSDKEPSIDIINETSVIVSPSATYSNVTVYAKIEYWHAKYLGCSKNESNTTVFVTTSNIIHNLKPFSQYRIKISYSIDKLTCIKETTFNTTESAILSNEEMPQITDNYIGTEAFVSINWECQHLRGLVSRSIDITSDNEYGEENIQYTKNDTISTTDLRFEINKQTRYIVKVHYQRGVENRSVIHNIFINPQKPHKVRNIIAYNVNETSISLKWLPPNPHTGVIELYEIEYYDDVSDMKKVKVDGSSYCLIWTEYICTTINNDNFLNTTYNFEIRAKNRQVGEYGAYVFFGLPFIRERVPSKPLNVNYTWNNEEIVTIEWQHPDVPNGQILRFLIHINKELDLTFNVTVERLNYIHKVNISSYNLRSKKLLIEIAAVNGIGISSLGQNILNRPEFLGYPTVENTTDSKFDITIPPANFYGDICKIYVIMTDTESPINRGKLHPKERALLDILGAKEEYSWVGGEFDIRHTTSITVGDNSTNRSELDRSWIVTNKILYSDRVYNATVLLLDVYYGITSQFTTNSSYSLTTKTLPMRNMSTNSQINFTMMILSSFGVYFWYLYQQQ